MKLGGQLAVVVALVALGACAKEQTTTEVVPLSPSGGSSAVAISLTAPVADSPAEDTLVTSLRPTLTVRNTTSNVASGLRLYEFQISDRNDFTIGGGIYSAYYVVVLTRTGVPEDASGRTSFTPDTDLLPATRLYWRARATQESTTSDWSATRSFRTKNVGYNRPGELYDPLTFDETIGERAGSTTFVSGKGLRINDENSWVRYLLAQNLSSGEFSVDVEGLAPGGPGSKAKIFSMMDGGSNLFTSGFLFNVQYRGAAGNPDNCISYKVIYGSSSNPTEPDFGGRSAGIVSLNPARTYFWKATWGTDFRLTVLDGGTGTTGVNGTMVYDRSQSQAGRTYNPNPHYAYLGANNGPFGQESGSYANALYRNVWIGNKPRPTALGSALDAQQ